MSVSWLTSYTLEVSVAFGADLTALDTTWTWTDITSDVRQTPGINSAVGRDDEQSVSAPANLKLVLNNTGSKYSLGPVSVYYPNVHKGTPVRVRVNTGSGYVVLFQGEAVKWQPGWDTMKGTVPVVSLEAAGILRRLSQVGDPVQSGLRRSIPTDTTCVAYWSMEDGKTATSFAPAVGLAPISWGSTAPTLASEDRFAGSTALPVSEGTNFYAQVPDFTATGVWRVWMLFGFPKAGTLADGTVLYRVLTSGYSSNIASGTIGVSQWDIR